ncbi:hypothetical protein niasHT_025293 [Heterodera trifolii]|uniref:BTB domain-containing protein n=1 Tax=Heterodera trifolii TaxID=157864 RepID=A0ABD2KA77_9BILA
MTSSSKKGDPIERMKHLLSSGEDADIQFLVGDGDKKELLSAHKLILKHASDVFEAMFHFDSQQEKTENASAVSPVEVPDVEPAAFKLMLSFIYSEDLSELNGDNAMAVLYAAKKYGIDRLVSPILEIPIAQLHSVFAAFVHARRFHLEDFSQQCLQYICQNASQLFNSDEFLQIDQNLLCELFDRDQLVISSEFQIWKAALRWADEKCRQNAIECSAENRRTALNPALFKIRFPLISPAAFAKQIVPSGVLSNDEFVGVYQFNAYPKFFRGVPGWLYPLKFPIQTRISDWNTAKGNNRGTLAMEIEKFSEFAREEVGNERNSEMEVSIKGLPWKISAKIRIDEESNKKWLGFCLWCTAPRIAAKGDNWSCKCSAIFRIVSQKSGMKDLIGKINDLIFSNETSAAFGFKYFVAFTELMDPCNGFYDKMEDKITLVIDVFVEEEENDEKFDSDPSKSNGQIVMEIDKLSEFARIPWKITAVKISEKDNTNKCLAVALQCFPQKDPNWSCECSATFRILSQKIGVDGFTEKFDKKHIFNGEECRGFLTWITFEELMDPSKGLYDKDGDKVTLAIDFVVDGKKGTKKRKLTDG